MELTTALLCDFAQVREGLLFVSSGGVTRCYRENVPSVLGVFLAVALEFDRIEAERAHEVRTVVVDEDGQELMALGGQIQLGQPDLMLGENVSVPITFDLRMVPVQRFGPVEVRVYVGGELRRVLSLWVLQSPSS